MTSRVAWGVGIALLALAGCTESVPQREAERASSTPSSATTEIPTEMPRATREVAGHRAARAMLDRPDVRPEAGYVAENGDVLVMWVIRGLAGRDASRCRYPVAMTWISRDGWRDGVRREEVRGWLLKDGMREVYSTPHGFYVGHSTCDGRPFADQSPGLVVDKGRLSPTSVGPETAAPWEGAVAIICPPPRRGYCQVDPSTAAVSRLTVPWSWRGAWDAAASILGRRSTNISGTWSIDGGRTWNETADAWDVSVARRDGRLFAVANGSSAWVGELIDGHRLPHITWWTEEDLVDVRGLPRSRDGYRWWLTTPDGALVGIARGDAVYVSEGTDWSRITRHDAGRCRDLDLVGRLLVCSGPGRSRTLRISDDLGSRWQELRLDEVRPHP